MERLPDRASPNLLARLTVGEPRPAGRSAALDLAIDRRHTNRRAFVDEVRLLGMLKAVQATEPRWLVLEDELGWSADERATRLPLEEFYE